MPGWGLQPWGLGPWGIGNLAQLHVSVANATATSERTVAVEFTGNVLSGAPNRGGDALNPAMWSLTRLDTGFTFIILSVRELVPHVEYELFTLQKLAPFEVMHRVTAGGVFTAAGIPLSAPNFADFHGLLAAQTVEQQKTNVVDIQNQQIPGDTLAGVLRVNSTGDYAIEGGHDLLKKLIFRRLTTVPGAYAHLGPEYGLGLREKETLPITDLRALKVAVERQVERESEVDTATAQITFKQNILTIILAVTLKNNQQFVYPISIPVSGVSL